MLWDVVRDDQGRIVRPLTREDPVDAFDARGPGSRLPDHGAAAAWSSPRPSGSGRTANGFELELKFESPDKDRTVSYNLLGPHGIPIEGEWYTGTFREVFFGTSISGAIEVVTYSAYDIAKATRQADRQHRPAAPVRGRREPVLRHLHRARSPLRPATRTGCDRETMAIVLHKDDKALQKADVGVRIASRPFQVGPNTPLIHTYRVFAGPKTDEALAPLRRRGPGVLPQEPVDPRRLVHRPRAHHAHPVDHLPGDRVGSPASSAAPEGTTASPSSC